MHAICNRYCRQARDFKIECAVRTQDLIARFPCDVSRFGLHYGKYVRKYRTPAIENFLTSPKHQVACRHIICCNFRVNLLDVGRAPRVEVCTYRPATARIQFFKKASDRRNVASICINKSCNDSDYHTIYYCLNLIRQQTILLSTKTSLCHNPNHTIETFLR